MLNDLMRLAWLDAELEYRLAAPFDAGVLLSDFCKTSQPLLKERGLDLKMERPVSMPVHGDRTKIQGNLQNLMLNALKYTRTGGVTADWGSNESHDAYAGSTFRVLLPRQFNE